VIGDPCDKFVVMGEKGGEWRREWKMSMRNIGIFGWKKLNLTAKAKVVTSSIYIQYTWISTADILVQDGCSIYLHTVHVDFHRYPCRTCPVGHPCMK